MAEHSAPVTVRAADLKSGGVVVCPTPQMGLWNQHPKVSVPVAATGEGRCPYCGTVYRLAEGESVGHGH